MALFNHHLKFDLSKSVPRIPLKIAPRQCVSIPHRAKVNGTGVVNQTDRVRFPTPTTRAPETGGAGREAVEALAKMRFAVAGRLAGHFEPS